MVLGVRLPEIHEGGYLMSFVVKVKHEEREFVEKLAQAEKKTVAEVVNDCVHAEHWRRVWANLEPYSDKGS